MLSKNRHFVFINFIFILFVYSCDCCCFGRNDRTFTLNNKKHHANKLMDSKVWMKRSHSEPSRHWWCDCVEPNERSEKPQAEDYVFVIFMLPSPVLCCSAREIYSLQFAFFNIYNNYNCCFDDFDCSWNSKVIDEIHFNLFPRNFCIMLCSIHLVAHPECRIKDNKMRSNRGMISILLDFCV